jgi:ATP-dependent DNA helicase RecG
MAENQNIEYKESWRDEYLKWLSGYANAYGGTLFIGKDDNGNVVGVQDSKKLMEDLPNKITNALGIIADVNLNTEDGKEFISITVEKYPSLIGYHGRYYYRSGSVLREIAGKELERALLKSQGITWDGVPLPKITVADLKPEAIALFKQKALARGRLTSEDANVSNEILMDNLHLVDEDGYLTRAAMLAFYYDPERWVTGSYIKIGFFGSSHSDLQYQDEVHGPLIEQIDRAIDLVYTKYLKARITYEGIQRIEVFMFPREAFREILLNAVVHKDYASCNSIQISVYDDEIYIWNDGWMPENLRTTESLFAKHSSKPFNPKLAHVFFISGMIEAWGRGFDKIRSACDALYHTPMPEYDIGAGGIMVHCRANAKYMELGMENRLGLSETILRQLRDETRENVIQIMEMVELKDSITSSEVQVKLGKPKPTVARILKKMCEMNLLKMVGGGRSARYQKSSQRV